MNDQGYSYVVIGFIVVVFCFFFIGAYFNFFK